MREWRLLASDLTMNLALFSRCLGVGLLLPSGVATAAQIVLQDFSVVPVALHLGDSFVVRARAVTKNVKLGSFLLRTASEVKKGDFLPGFPLQSNRCCYVSEGGTIHLLDNGALDRDKAAGAFALEVSTKGWREGRCELAFFASNRPASGPFVAARHDFAVMVHGEQVTIEDLGGSSPARSVAITGFVVKPATVEAGQAVAMTVRFAPEKVARLQITNALFIGQTEVLPGFSYDPAKKKSVLEVPAQNGETAFRLDTAGWLRGAHHLLLQALSASGRAVDERPFAFQVRGPQDRRQITVEPPTLLGEGTHFGRFAKLSDGTLLCGEKLSRDGGRTWEDGTGGFGEGAEQLRDGHVIGLAYRCLPIKEKEGWYTVTRSLSPDGQRFDRDEVQMFVPEAKGAMGHGPHVGPLFMRSILERKDGSLVAYMAGWFKSDVALCPYGHGRPYSRSYVCESADGGKTWRYLTTIGYEQIGSEGYNEGSMRCLPDGSWLAVMRTGNAHDLDCQDNPIMASFSRDEGRTWSKPQRTGLKGCYPSLAVLSDGSLVMSYGRPGAMIAFSGDGGRTWTDETCVDATVGSGYTDVVELEPGLLLVGFGTQGYFDGRTGERTDGLRLARVRCRKG
jgi:hypothetical protein